MKPISVLAEPAFRTSHANPYNAALYAGVVGLGAEVEELGFLRLAVRAPSIVHLHWPELLFLSGHRRWRVVARLLGFYGALAVARLRGTRLVWTVHNIDSHERRFGPVLRAWSERWLTANVDAVICLTDDAVEPTRARYPRLAAVPAFVAPHGHYRGWYPTAEREPARAALGIRDADSFVATVGQIRPYKNVTALLAASAGLADPAVVIGIAGRPSSPSLRDEVQRAAAGRADVRLRLEFVPDEALAEWMAAADVVVLPYRAIQNSGSALLALSLDRPVVVPDAGAMRALQALAGPEWVQLYQGDFDAADLRRAVDWASGTDRGPAPDLALLDWDGIAARTLAVYREVAVQPRSVIRRKHPAAA